MLPKDVFRVGRELEAAYAEIRAEVAALREEDFADWPDRGAYSAGWRVFPLVMAERPEGFEPDLERNRRSCPRTAAAIARFPEIVQAGISRLHAGCHVYRHRDAVAPRVYRYHLPLRVDGEAGFRAGTTVTTCAEGRAYVFDHREEHEAGNLGRTPRDVLLVDFVATEAELDALARWRAAADAAGGARGGSAGADGTGA